jgi:hypothetical protein
MENRVTVLAASLVALILTASATSSEPTNADSFEICRSGESLERLEAQRSSLENALSIKRTELENLARRISVGTPAEVDQLRSLAAGIEADEGAIIKLLYQIDCLRVDRDQKLEEVRGAKTAVEITLFYVTNRNRTDSKDISAYYGAGNVNRIDYGTVSVTIPAIHTMGALELPSLWKLEFSPDPTQHFVLRSLSLLSSMEVMARLTAEIQRAKNQKSLLLFVHGFNVSFSDAALRTAQLAYDLKFPGIAMFYSWPSAARVWGYLHDEESAELARQPLQILLDDLSQLPFENIYISFIVKSCG